MYFSITSDCGTWMIDNSCYYYHINISLHSLCLVLQVNMAADNHSTAPTASLWVRLHPFLHQVSGSSLMFMFDQHTICKSLQLKEYDFYKVLPDGLKSFTADCKGRSSSLDICITYHLLFCFYVNASFYVGCDTTYKTKLFLV